MKCSKNTQPSEDALSQLGRNTNQEKICLTNYDLITTYIPVKTGLIGVTIAECRTTYFVHYFHRFLHATPAYVMMLHSIFVGNANIRNNQVSSAALLRFPFCC